MAASGGPGGHGGHGGHGGQAILLTTAELAEITDVTLEVVDHWRKTGIGPVPIGSGAARRYDLADVQEFLTLQRGAKLA